MLDSWILLALLYVYFHNKYSSKNGKVIIEVKDTTTKLYYCLLLVVQPQKKATMKSLEEENGREKRARERDNAKEHAILWTMLLARSLVHFTFCIISGKTRTTVVNT